MERPRPHTPPAVVVGVALVVVVARDVELVVVVMVARDVELVVVVVDDGGL